MTIPVYLFTGFLESGKTTLIKDTLLDPGFQSGEKTLLLACEEGMEECDDEFLNKTNTSFVSIDRQEDLSYAFMKKCDSLIEPDRVMIEYNGTWNLTEFLESVELPYDWLIVQIISTVNTKTFETYVGNMRSLIYEQLLHSEAIIFNRCDETTKKLYLRNNIKAINKGAQLIYEMENGEISDLGEDEMPFDVNANPIIVSDDDYGLWYMDAMEHLNKYDGKNVILKGKVIATKVEGKENAFVFGRHAMVCCADDTSLIGLLCESQHDFNIQPDEWITITGKVRHDFDEEYQGDILIIEVNAIESVEALEDEFVYFT